MRQENESSPEARGDSDVDHARAAGVLIEFERGRPIIVDRALYRELVKAAIKRTHDELEAKVAVAARDKKTARAGKAPADPLAVAKRERDAQLRELSQAGFDGGLDSRVLSLGRGRLQGHAPSEEVPARVA
jgi:hypothetical protein